MVSVFYIAAVITIFASIKAITSLHSMNALLYFVVSLLATAVVFFMLGAYFSAILIVILFAGAVSLLFLSVYSLLNLRKDVVEQNKRGISPKIWLGPLLLVFVLFVMLLYGIVSTDYSTLQVNNVENVSLINMFLGSYILVIELGILLLLCGLVIAYHFIYRLYIHKGRHSLSANINEGKNDSTNA